MRKNQCAFWALDRCISHGGGIVIVMSAHWKMPHLQWMSDDERISHFVPPGDLQEPWHSLFGFEGTVRYEDGYRQPLTRTAIRRGIFALGMIWAAWAARNTWRDIKRIFSPTP